MTLTEGPLGFPMPDRAARAVDAVLRTLPKTKDYEYRKALVARPPTELNPGERSDVSWISTEAVDRTGEVVVARGMNDAQFQANPLVTIGHAYHLPPVGRSLWRRRVKDGDTVGIKAKTTDPARPRRPPAADRPVIPFTTLDEIERHIGRCLDGVDFPALARRALDEGLDRARGRV